MPTSAVVTAADEFPSLRLRHNRENTSDNPQAEKSKRSHPLTSAYYEMPSAGCDRYTKCICFLRGSRMYNLFMFVFTCSTSNLVIKMYSRACRAV